MQILMITDVYFPRINGVSTSIKTFRSSLQSFGHRVVLIAPEYGDHEDDDPDILRIPSRTVPMDPEDRLMFLSEIMQLLPRLEREGFDVVHVHTPFTAHYAGVRLARRLGLPLLESYHTYFEEYLFHYIPFLPKRALRWAARHFSRRQCNEVDRVLVPSRAMEQVLRDYGIGKPLTILPTGIPLDEIRSGARDDFADEYGYDPGRPTLVHVGRIAFEKNVSFLVDMVHKLRRRIPDILLIIAGEGPAFNRIRNQIARLHLEDNVLMVGYLDREFTLWNCYKAGDVFVFASGTETQGLVLLEAMAMGVPVVSTACMGTRDLLEDGVGCLVAEEDVRDFANQVYRLLSDRELHDRLGCEALRKVHDWSAEAMARRLEVIYCDMTGQPAELLGNRRVVSGFV